MREGWQAWEKQTRILMGTYERMESAFCILLNFIISSTLLKSILFFISGRNYSEFVFSRHLWNTTIILPCAKHSLKRNMRFFTCLIYLPWFLWTAFCSCLGKLRFQLQTLFLHENRRRWGKQRGLHMLVINLSPLTTNSPSCSSSPSRWWFSHSTNARFNASFSSYSFLCASIRTIIYKQNAACAIIY